MITSIVFVVPLTAHDARRVAVAAAVHPKTVVRAYRGLVVRSTCSARIVGAARSLGLPEPPTLPRVRSRSGRP